MELKDLFTADVVKIMTPAQLEIAIKTIAAENAKLAQAQTTATTTATKVETKEEPKAWKDRSLEEKYETERKRAESFKKINKLDNKSFKMCDPSKGISFFCRLKNEWVDKKGDVVKEDKIIIKLIDFHEDYIKLATELDDMGFKRVFRKFGKSYVFSAQFDNGLWKDAVEVITEQMNPETKAEQKAEETTVSKEEIVEEPEEVEEVEEPVFEEVEVIETEDVEVEEVEQVKKKIKKNAELLEAKAKKEPVITEQRAEKLSYIMDLILK